MLQDRPSYERFRLRAITSSDQAMRRVYQEANERASIFETIDDHTEEIPWPQKPELTFLRDHVFVRPRPTGLSNVEGYELLDTWD